MLHDGIRELAEPTGHVGCFGPKSQSFSVASGSTVARPSGSGYFQIPKGWLVNLSHTLFCPERAHVLDTHTHIHTHTHTQAHRTSKECFLGAILI